MIPTRPLALGFVAMLVSSACGVESAGSSSAGVSAPPPGSPPSATVSATASATPTLITPRPSTPPPTTPSRRCASGVVTLRIGQAEAPRPICVTVGSTLRITTEPSPLQPWAPLESTDTAVIRCQSYRSAEGAITGTCVAAHAGKATVSTTTAAFAGDPHGPPQFSWQLPVTVA